MPLKCDTCEGTGKVPLLVSLTDCDTCKGRGTVLTEKERIKQKLIAEYINTPAGRAKLARSLTQPKRKRRDYTSVGRKSFREKMAA
jgi:RecJ-like exonuclease